MRRASLGILSALVAATVVISGAPSALAADKDCDQTSTGLIPLTDLGSGIYLDYQGGLYPDGANDAPVDHAQLGLELGGQVVPRDASGQPASNGLIGLLGVGVSNTKAEFSAFEDLASRDANVSPSVVLINGAQGSRPLEDWAAGSSAEPWRELTSALENEGISAEQVQVAWIKLPSGERGTSDLKAAGAEIDQLIVVLQELSDRFPNLRLGYLSSRIYAGYALREGERLTLRNGAEPKAYQHGFVVKWLIEQQIEGDLRLNPVPSEGVVEAPWIGWGPYLWADGLTSRGDGLTWECEDLATDGIHPSEGGALKVAELLLEHFSTNSTSNGWFLRGSGQPPTTAHTGSSGPVVSSTTTGAAPAMTGVGSSTTRVGSETTEVSPDPGVGAPAWVWFAIVATISLLVGQLIRKRLLSRGSLLEHPESRER